MKDVKKLSDSELEKVTGGDYIPGPGELTIDPFPREDWDIWECYKCHDVRERFTKDRTFWNTNNECSCGGWYNLKGTKKG